MTAGPLGGVSTDTPPTVAVPAPISASASAGSIDPEATRTDRPNRDAERPAAADVGQRQAVLGEQGKAIAKASAVAKAKAAEAKAKAVAKAKAEKAAQEKAKAEKAARETAKAEKAAQAKAAQEKAKYAAVGYDPSIADPREIARQMMQNKWGWGADQYSCLNNIVIRESNWQIDATNASSGAYGIPQSLPGTKMATVAADWRTNPATQITWMLGYLEDRYGTPCGGWAFKSSHGWY